MLLLVTVGVGVSSSICVSVSVLSVLVSSFNCSSTLKYHLTCQSPFFPAERMAEVAPSPKMIFPKISLLSLLCLLMCTEHTSVHVTRTTASGSAAQNA